MIQSRHLSFWGYLMFRLKHFRHLAVFALLVVAACGRQSTVTVTVDPTDTTVSEQPTATLVQSHPTIEAPPSPIVLPTSTEIAASGPTDYPAGVNSLTGLEVASYEKLERRPLLIKVSNFPRGNRPQWGLSLADLVFEHYTEAGSTRFSALFFGSDAERVGPIRSARFFDVELIRMYNAIFAFGSADSRVRARIYGSEWATLAVSEFPAGCPPMCRFDPANYNHLVARTADLQAYSEGLGVSNDRPPLEGMAFDYQVPQGGEPGLKLDLRYSLAAFNQWTYDPESGLYFRAQETGADQFEVAPLEDALTGQRIAAANVIVIFVLHEYYLVSPEMIDIRIYGRGPALVFRDGQVFSVAWVRDGLYNVLTFETDDGQPFPMKPGNSWIAVVGSTSGIEVPEADAWTVRFSIP